MGTARRDRINPDYLFYRGCIATKRNDVSRVAQERVSVAFALVEPDVRFSRIRL